LNRFAFRDERPDGFNFIGPDRSPVDAVKYFRTEEGLGPKAGNIHAVGFAGEMFDPEDLADVEIEIPANSFSKTFSAGCFKEALAGLGRYHDVRPKMFDIRLVHGQIDNPQAPGTGPFAD